MFVVLLFTLNVGMISDLLRKISIQMETTQEVSSERTGSKGTYVNASQEVSTPVLCTGWTPNEVCKNQFEADHKSPGGGQHFSELPMNVAP